MQRRVPDHPQPHPWGLTALLVLLLGGATTLGGDKGGKAEPPAKGRSRLLMLVHVRADENHPPLTREQLERTMAIGIEKSRCSCDSISILPISERDYRNIQNLTSGLVAQPEVVDDEEPQMRQQRVVGKDARVEWEFRLPHSYNEKGLFPRELKVEFQQGEPWVRELGKARDPKADFFPKDGAYHVRLPADRVPKSWTAALLAPGKGPAGTLTRNFSNVQNFYYVIVLNNFSEGEGSRDRLILTVKDKGQVPDPLSNVELGNEFTFLFAAVNADIPRTKEGFDGNEYVVHIPALEGRSAKRVWMLFPIPKDQATKTVAAWQGYSLKDLPQKMAAAKMVRAGDKIEITANMPPTWIEVPPIDDGKNGFSRRLKLSNIKELQKTLPEVRRLLVWDFDESGKLPVPITVLNPATNSRVYVLEQDMQQWPQGIREQANRSK